MSLIWARCLCLGALLSLGAASVQASDRWALYLDNDVYAPRSTDRDYTYGIFLTKDDAPSPQNQAWYRPLGWIDKLFMDQDMKALSRREIGVLGFTPTNIVTPNPLPDNRPYAGMIFLGATHIYVNDAADTSWTTNLTVGLLGSGLPGELQQATHNVIGDANPRGWDNQIAEGGELTARYAWSRRQLLPTNNDLGLWYETTLALGYLSEARLGIGGLFGAGDPLRARVTGPTGIGHRADPQGTSSWTFWYGADVSLRAHNAFLQGQFRDSVVEYDLSETEPVVAQVWAGLDVALFGNWTASYAVYGRSSELKFGPADRNHFWATISIGTQFN